VDFISSPSIFDSSVILHLVLCTIFHLILCGRHDRCNFLLRHLVTFIAFEKRPTRIVAFAINRRIFQSRYRLPFWRTSSLLVLRRIFLSYSPSCPMSIILLCCPRGCPSFTGHKRSDFLPWGIVILFSGHPCWTSSWRKQLPRWPFVRTGLEWSDWEKKEERKVPLVVLLCKGAENTRSGRSISGWGRPRQMFSPVTCHSFGGGLNIESTRTAPDSKRKKNRAVRGSWLQLSLPFIIYFF
jgi:hypothetical protein